MSPNCLVLNLDHPHSEYPHIQQPLLDTDNLWPKVLSLQQACVHLRSKVSQHTTSTLVMYQYESATPANANRAVYQSWVQPTYLDCQTP